MPERSRRSWSGPPEYDNGLSLSPTWYRSEWKGRRSNHQPRYNPAKDHVKYQNRRGRRADYQHVQDPTDSEAPSETASEGGHTPRARKGKKDVWQGQRLGSKDQPESQEQEVEPAHGVLRCSECAGDHVATCSCIFKECANDHEKNRKKPHGGKAAKPPVPIYMPPTKVSDNRQTRWNEEHSECYLCKNWGHFKRNCPMRDEISASSSGSSNKRVKFYDVNRATSSNDAEEWTMEEVPVDKQWDLTTVTQPEDWYNSEKWDDNWRNWEKRNRTSEETYESAEWQKDTDGTWSQRTRLVEKKNVGHWEQFADPNRDFDGGEKEWEDEDEDYEAYSFNGDPYNTHITNFYWTCAFCTKQLWYMGDKNIFREEIECYACHNARMHLEGGKVKTKRQFQRFAREQHRMAVEGVSAEVISITQRSCSNPHRSQEKVVSQLQKLTRDQQRRAAAVMDYITKIVEGLSGFYACRTGVPINPDKIVRVIPPVVPIDQGGTGKMIPRLYDLDLDGELFCKNLVPAGNKWYRDGKAGWRCPWNGCPWARWKDKTGSWVHEVPSYLLVIYGPGAKPYYLRAEPPPTDVDNELALLKLMMCEEDILSLIRQESHGKDIWRGINDLCNKEFAVCARHCTQAVIRLEKVGEFQVTPTEGSLDTRAYGHEISAIMMKEDEISGEIFGEKDWRQLLAVYTLHFFVGTISEKTWDKLGPSNKRIANRFNKGSWRGDKAIRPRTDTQPMMSKHAAMESLAGNFSDCYLAPKGSSSSSSSRSRRG